MAAKRDFGIGLGGAINDQFCVDIEPEAFGPLDFAAKGAGDTGDARGTGSGGGG